MAITLKDILDAETATRNVRAALSSIGRELYKMRDGNELGPEYGFESYERMIYQGDHYSGQDGPDWGIGTPILSLSYYWSRAQAQEYVTLPQSWIEDDWRTLEKARLDEVRTKAEIQAKLDREQEALQREASERAAYARLKAKFETNAPQADVSAE